MSEHQGSPSRHILGGGVHQILNGLLDDITSGRKVSRALWRIWKPSHK